MQLRLPLLLPLSRAHARVLPLSGGPGREVNYVYFAQQPVRLTATTCFGGAHGVENSGSTAIAADVRIYDYCPAFASKATQLAENDPAFTGCAVTTLDVHSPGTYWLSIEDAAGLFGTYEPTSA